MYGRLEMPAEFSRTAFTAKEGLAALERLKDGPFTLTISFGPPHPPMVVSEPYYSLYPPDSHSRTGQHRRSSQQLALPRKQTGTNWMLIAIPRISSR